MKYKFTIQLNYLHYKPKHIQSLRIVSIKTVQRIIYEPINIQTYRCTSFFLFPNTHITKKEFVTALKHKYIKHMCRLILLCNLWFTQTGVKHWWLKRKCVFISKKWNFGLRFYDITIFRMCGSLLRRRIQSTL